MNLFVSEYDRKLAEKLAQFSLELTPGNNVMLHLIGLNGIGLLQALVEVTRNLGANPFVRIDDTEINRILIEQGDADFWKHQASVEQLPLMKQMDAYVGIRASENIFETSQSSKEAYKAYGEHLLTPVHFDERVNNTR